MTVHAAGTPFSSARRRAIALACRNAPRTRAQLGRQIGVDPGSLESVVRALRDEGVLETTTVGYARGAAFVLRAEWRDALDEAVAAVRPPGVIHRGLRLLVVAAGNQSAVEDGLAAAAVDPTIVWAARLDGQARILLALDVSEPRGAEQADRLEGTFSRAGAQCVHVLVSEVMARPRFAAYAHSVADRPHREVQAPAG